MDIAEVKREAEKWLATDGSYRLLTCDETERKLVFGSCIDRSVTFYLRIPDSPTDNWFLWSDSGSALDHLQHVIDHLSSTQPGGISEVLSKVQASLIQKQVVKLNELVTLQLYGAESDAVTCDDDDDDDDDDNDDFSDYYADQQVDETPVETSKKDQEDYRSQFTGSGSSAATQRLLKDFANLSKAEGKYGVTGKPRGDNLYHWDVHLADIPVDSKLGKDLKSYSKRYKRQPVIEMELLFPKDYPFSPPFARVIRPRFKFLTGHITIGGSVCMELLTKSGWSSCHDIESILIQIRTEILGDSNACLAADPDRVYSEIEARQAFERMVHKYGWKM